MSSFSLDQPSRIFLSFGFRVGVRLVTGFLYEIKTRKFAFFKSSYKPLIVKGFQSMIINKREIISYNKYQIALRDTFYLSRYY